MIFNSIQNPIYPIINFNLINKKIVCIQTKIVNFCINIPTVTNLKEDISVIETQSCIKYNYRTSTISKFLTFHAW